MSLIASCTVQTLCKKQLPLLDADEVPSTRLGRGGAVQAQVVQLRFCGRLQGDGKEEACLPASLPAPPFMFLSGAFSSPCS